MVRTIIAENRLEAYLENLFEAERFSYGVIIGQPSKYGKEYVVHLARTPEETFEDINSLSTNPKQIPVLVNSLNNINTPVLIDHAISVTRIIPGSFFVLGFFIVTPNNIFDTPDDLQKVRTIVEQYGDLCIESSAGKLDKFDNGEKLILHYSGIKTFTCRSFDSRDYTGITKGFPVDWRFQDRVNWIEIDTTFDVESVFPLLMENDSYNLDKTIWQSVDSLTGRLHHSLILFNGEPLDENETLDAIIKQKARYRKQPQKVQEKTIWQSSIYFPYSDKLHDDELKIEKYCGNIKFVGLIASKIWIHPKSIVQDVQYFICTDISRSFGARLRLHQDTVPFDEYAKEADLTTLLEVLPRRVYYNLKSSPIQFSDYLFREEAAETCVEQVKSVLDITIENGDVILDAEALPDRPRRNLVVAVNEFVLPPEINMERALYMIGIYFVLGMFIIILVCHLFFNYECIFNMDSCKTNVISEFVPE